MEIKYILKEDDVVEEVQLMASPMEYLVISAALKQFIDNHNNHTVDIEVAKSIRKEIENRNDG